MKRIAMLLFLLVSLTLVGQNVFIYEDFVGDDNGPGVYTYPSDPVFRKGSFDLKKFTIRSEGSEYVFIFEIDTNFKNEWSNKNGWDVQMFDVYLRFEEGKYTQTIAGRNVKLNQGWDKVVVVSPEENTKMWSKEIRGKNEEVGDNIYLMENLLDGILLPESYEVNGNKLFARIKKDNLKEMDKISAIQVFVSGAEGYPDSQQSYIRNVNELASQWRFGGGTDYYGNPNVIDILGSNKQLGSYKSTEDIISYAEVNMVELERKNSKFAKNKNK